MTTPKSLPMLREMQNKIQCDINFKKNQVTIESLFTKLA